MASWYKSTVLIEKQHMYLTNTLQSQNSNFIALLFWVWFFFVCFFFLPYHWSSWTVYVQQWDWLKGFLLLGTNYDRAWFYDLSLQHPPTLWARSEGSSVSIGHLHCTWRQIHTTTELLKIKKLKNGKYHQLHCFDLAIEHMANLQQVCMACSIISPVSEVV